VLKQKHRGQCCQTQLEENLGSAGTQQIKMFVWRLTHNSLASGMKIMRLGVDLDICCPVCHRLNEDGGQIFLKCKMFKAC
jgi:hypothetical protein